MNGQGELWAGRRIAVRWRGGSILTSTLAWYALPPLARPNGRSPRSTGKRRSQRTRESDFDAHMNEANHGSRRREGHVAEHSLVALLIIDVVNALDFEGSQRLVRRAEPAAQRLSALREKASRAKFPTIFVNDNFGRWRSDFKSMVRHCSREEAPGRHITRLLAPREEDYFVLKPYNSGFFNTALQALLEQLRAKTLILTGITTDNCVLFTAHDAYLHGYRLFIPTDCCIAEKPAHHAQALSLMERTMKADTRPSTKLRLSQIARARGHRSPT
jgi:nicotinamidase-related amidase